MDVVGRSSRWGTFASSRLVIPFAVEHSALCVILVAECGEDQAVYVILVGKLLEETSLWRPRWRWMALRLRE
jgi:hypothetical protein